MKDENIRPEDLEWMCAACNKPLEKRTVTVSYMDNQFTVELPACSQCGFVMISEAVALGKMAEVEQILEDK